MPKVLTMESETTCGAATPHVGKIAKQSTEKLTVNGKPVLTQDSVMAKAIAGCTVTPSSTTTPCTKVASVISKMSTKLTVNGKPVLVGLAGTCDPSPPASPTATGTLSANAVQTKLDAL